jgi:tRNA threonylcarbamoyladenosine biosynthesis protein TsaB
MMLLALDTSTRMIGLALFDGVQILSEIMWQTSDYHTVELAPSVADILARSNVKVMDLTALAVAIGPGSFTGLRIGLALAKGLALANRLPLVGIPSLDILAAAQPVRQGLLVAVLRAGRGRLAVGWYQASNSAWRPKGAPAALTAQELSERIQEPTLVCGELTEEEQRLLARKRKNVILAPAAQSVRRPAWLAELGWKRWLTGRVDDPNTLSPIYLHYNEPIPG